MLKDWIKAHTKEAPNPHEEPLSIKYLWETPTRRSSSSQRGSQEIPVHRDHRRSSSTTSTHTVSSQGSLGGSNVYGMQSDALQSLIASSSHGSGDFSAVANHHTARARHPYGDAPASANTHQPVHPHPAYHAAHQAYPSQPHNSDAISGAINAPRYATTQIQNQSVSQNPYLTVPGPHSVVRQPQVNLVFTNEQGARFDPNGMLYELLPLGMASRSRVSPAATPLLIPNHWPEASYPDASPVSSTFLSPSSPYASSIISSSSSLDDGSWDQGPPSPSYFSNELFTDPNQSTSAPTQGMYYQPHSSMYPPR